MGSSGESRLVMDNTIENPYVGPRTFTKKERSRFFGRDREARELLTLAVSEQLVVFYAQSGAGKSSLINTCLVPDLEEKKSFKVFPVARVGGDAPPGLSVKNIFTYNLLRILTPSDIPPESLAELDLSAFFAQQKKDTPPAALSEESEPVSQRQILIIDQFEEIFSTHHDLWQDREAFFSQLADAMEENPNLWVMLVMREDYIAHLDPYAHLLPDRARIRYYMQRLGIDAAVKAIKGPVERLRPYEKGVAEQLANDLASIKVPGPDDKIESRPGQYVEPVQLQVVCFNLWKQLGPGKTITASDLESVGDVNASLASYYDGVVQDVAEKMNYSERKIRQWIGEKLIAQGGIRNMVLQEPGETSADLENRVIQGLSGIVRAEPRGASTFYELTHDRLVEPIIASNREWFAEHLSPLQKQAALWSREGQKESWLFSDQALAEVEKWAEEHPDELNEIDAEFLEECRRKQKEIDRELQEQKQRLIDAQKRAEDQARTTRITRAFLAVAVIAFAFAVWGFVRASQSSQKAEKAGADAIEKSNIAATAKAEAISEKNKAQALADFSRANELAEDAMQASSFDQSILLSVAAYDKAKTNRNAQNALLENYGKVERLQRIYYDPENPAKHLALSPNGEVLAIWGDGGLTIWNETDMKNFPVEDSSLDVYFSPDSKILVATGNNGIQRWDTTSLVQLPGDFNGHVGTITDLIPNQDGKSFLSIGEGNQIQRWEVDHPDGIKIPVESESIVVISPTGDALSSVDQDGNLQLWNVADASPINDVILSRYSAFSPDGKFLATVNIDRSITVINIQTAKPVLDFNPGMDGEITAMVFSPDSRYLAIADSYPLTRVWDIQENEAVSGLLNGSPQVFSPDAKLLFMGAGFSQPYCVETQKLLDVFIYGNITGFSHDATVMLVNESGVTSLWKLSAACEINVIKNVTFQARGVQFSPEENIFASLEPDGTVSLHDSVNGKLIKKLASEPADKNSTKDSNASVAPTISEAKLFFSPSGHFLARLANKDLTIWNLESEGQSISLPESLIEGDVTGLIFTQDDRLITSHQNGMIKVWTLANDQASEQSSVQAETRGRITDLRFDPDTPRMLSISPSSVFLLDRDTGTVQTDAMKGEYLDVNWISNRLATLQQNQISIWDLETGKLLDNSVEGKRANFTPDGKLLLISDGPSLTLYNASDLSQSGDAVDNPFQSVDYEGAVDNPFQSVNYEVAFSPNGKVFALAEQGFLLHLYCMDTESLKFMGTSSYGYGGLIVFADNRSLYFNELGNTYIDRLDWTPLCVEQAIRSADIGLGSGSTPVGLDRSTYVKGMIGSSGAPTSIAALEIVDIRNFYSFSKRPILVETINVDFGQSIAMQDFRFASKADDAKLLATLGEDGKVYVWKINTETKETNADQSPVSAGVISVDGQTQATFSKDGIVIVSDTSQPFNEHVMKVTDGYFINNGQILVALGENDQIVLYDVVDVKKIGSLIDGTLDDDFVGREIVVTTESKTGMKTIWNTSAGENAGKKITDITSPSTLEDISPNGRIFAIQMENSEGDPVINLWGVEGQLGDPIAGTFKHFSPEPESQYFSSESEGSTQIWKLQDNQPSRVGDPIPGSFLSFSADGKYAAVSTPDDKIALLETATGLEVTQPIDGDFLAFGPEPKPGLMTYRLNGQIFIWDIDAKANRAGKVIRGDDAEFSADGRFLIARSVNANTFVTTSTLLNTDTMQRVIEDMSTFNLEFSSPDGQILVTSIAAEGSPLLTLWKNGKKVEDTSESEGLYGFSSDGTTMILRQPDGSFMLRDTSNPETSVDLSQYEKVFFSQENRFAVTMSGKDGSIALWDINRRSQMRADFSDVDPNSIESAQFSLPASGRKILALFGSNGIVLINIDTGQKLSDAPLQEPSGMVTSMLFSRDNKYLATLGSDGIIVSSVGPDPATVDRVPNHDIKAMAFGSDNDTLIYLTNDFEVYEAAIDGNPEEGTLLKKIINNAKAVCASALSDDGGKVALQIDNKIILWDRESPASVSNLTEIGITNPCTGGLGALSFSPDSTVLVVADGTRIHLVNTRAGTETELNVSSTMTSIARVRFVDDETIAVQSAPPDEITDTVIGLWNINTRSKIDQLFTGNLNGLVSNGSILFYRDPDGQVVLWDLNADQDLRPFDEKRSFLCGIVSGRQFSESEWQQFFPNEEYAPDSICSSTTTP